MAETKKAESPTPGGQSMSSNSSMLDRIWFKPNPEPCTDKMRESVKPDCSEMLEDPVLLAAQKEMKAKLRERHQRIPERLASQDKQASLNDIYTELYLIEGGSRGFNNEHEVRQIEAASKKQTPQERPINCKDIFQPLPGQDKPIRTVLTNGIAGIGKTVSVQKFIIDWAEGKDNQDVHFMCPLPFRDLNRKAGEKYSLVQLLHHYFPEMKAIDSIDSDKIKIGFIFDGLDECRLLLDFQNNNILHDVTEPTSVDVLLTNLIQGNLLPSALLWITSRPAAANQIPPECVHKMTEIRGFTDLQKEQYFEKKITDQKLVRRIINHIKTSRSLHIMCYIPLFCWILATVLEYILDEADCEDVPKTLTQMYIHFLQIQISMSNKKYNKATETNPKELSQSDKEMILKLGKLAFQQLERGNLIFYEKDLRESGIDISEASVFSEVCTEIFKEESWLCREKVFCFVHLSIQEFIAAVYKVHSCVDKDRNGSIHQMSDLHRSVISEALQSQNGHLDLFLRFFLGLSLEDNQALLGGLPSQTKNTSQTINETVKYIKEKIKEESSADRTLNLFHCLNELGDNSLVEEIQDSLRSGTLSDKELEPHQCSALAYVMLMSEERMDEFDLKSYNTSAAGQQRLIPVLKNVRSASLDKCHLNEECCETLASALQSPDSDLRELDVSYNDMGDPGVLCLDAGLMSPHCKLEKLALAGCKLTDKSFEVVAFALMSGHSNLREVDLSYNDVGDSGIQLICDGLVSPHCKLQKLRLAGCNISRESCERLASALPFADPQLKKLSLSYNNFGRSEMKKLCAAGQSCPLWKLQTLDFSFNDLEESGAWFLNGLLGQQCRLEKLALSGCNLTHESLETLASALQSPNSHLIELDLSYNNLGDSEFQLLGNGLRSPHCKLAKLGLAGCYLSYGCCETLVSAFMSQNACLRELDVSYNNLGDCGVKLLCAGLTSPLCHIEILNLRECNITGVCCSDLATVLYSYNSKLKELELRDNNLQNSGLALLSAVLRDIHCEVQRLGLSGCRITEEGCIFLALALRSNPSHLKELDLSYNHPGDSGVKQLSAVLEDPHSMLKKLRVDHGGECRVKAGLRKYACLLSLDPKTAHPHLSLSKGNREVTRNVENQQPLDHPDRFQHCHQVLSKEYLTSRCYWEIEWSRTNVDIGATYKRINRKGVGSESMIGMNNKSFSLVCHREGYHFCHNGRIIKIATPLPPSKRIGVCLDWPAGTLAFYSVASDTVTHLHTFHTTFTEPLHPAFVVYMGSTLTLCQLD